MRDIALWDDYTAKIEAIASVNIRAQVGGYLKSINFKEGENVKKGDLLFVIDPRPYEAALASAEAELAEAKARVELAKTNLERAKELYAADVVAKSSSTREIARCFPQTQFWRAPRQKCATQSSISNTQAYARQCQAR